jgi:hypothetical protein
MIGIMLLAFGRRLFWLFVGGIGFVVGLQAAGLYVGWQPYWLAWAVALLFGIIGALLAVFFQTLAVVLGGFAAGGTIGAYLAALLGVQAVAAFFALGGVIGAILLYLLFDWALIGLSAAAGAALVVGALNWHARAELLLFAVLIAAGIWFQAAWMRRPTS